MGPRTTESVDAGAEDGAIEHQILQAIKTIRYGSVEIIIHDSKIVQIELKEKVRFDRCRKPESR